LKLFTQALWAGLVAYITASLFASTEYNLYPYFMIGYTCAIIQIAKQPRTGAEVAETPGIFVRTSYDGFRRTRRLRSS
jgi:hypothetical protein